MSRSSWCWKGESSIRTEGWSVVQNNPKVACSVRWCVLTGVSLNIVSGKRCTQSVWMFQSFSHCFTAHLRNVFNSDLQYPSAGPCSSSLGSSPSSPLSIFVNFVSHAPNPQSQSVSWWNTMMKCVYFDVCSTELKRCVCVLRCAGLRQSVERVESRRRLMVPLGHCQIDGDVQEHSFLSEYTLVSLAHINSGSCATQQLCADRRGSDEWRDAAKMALGSQTLHVGMSYWFVCCCFF